MNRGTLINERCVPEEKRKAEGTTKKHVLQFGEGQNTQRKINENREQRKHRREGKGEAIPLKSFIHYFNLKEALKKTGLQKKRLASKSGVHAFGNIWPETNLFPATAMR